MVYLDSINEFLLSSPAFSSGPVNAVLYVYISTSAVAACSSTRRLDLNSGQTLGFR